MECLIMKIYYKYGKFNRNLDSLDFSAQYAYKLYRLRLSSRDANWEMSFDSCY